MYYNVYIRYVECSGGLVELAEEDGQHLPLGGPHLQYRGKAAKRGKSLPPRQPRGLNHQGEWLELFFFFFGGGARKMCATKQNRSPTMQWVYCILECF